MVVGFTSHECIWCTARVETLRLYEGYVAADDARLYTPQQVFFQEKDARRWALENGLHSRKIIKVLSPKRFKWNKTRRGIIGLIVSDKLFCVVPDHKFDPNEPLVFLAPPDYALLPRPHGTEPEKPEDTRSEGDRLMDFFRK